MFIVFACMTCHNFIRLHALQDDLFDEYQDEDMMIEQDELPHMTWKEIDISESNMMFRKRDEIADEIFASS
mgnify:CR=1 FL=1